MFWLKTFGGLSLSRTSAGDGGDGGAGVASQRKTLALLAILAAAGARGIPRDRLLLLLWPESDTERARGALKTMVHGLRRQLGGDAVEGVAELRLGPTVISSDLAQFRAALVAGDDAAAVAAYGGPFLDGVFVDGTAEFERWASDERSRLQVELCGALERLATRASAEGRVADAVRWWRARHASDPLHAPTSLRLMQALVAAGDRDGALLHARAHGALVRSELDVPADPEVTRYAEALRSGVGHASRTASAGEKETAAASSNPGWPADVPPAPALVTYSDKTAKEQRPRRSSRAPWLAGGALLLAAVIVVAVSAVRRDRAGGQTSLAVATDALRANRVAVAIFVNRTGERSLDALGTMGSDWVTRGLARTPGAEVFDIGGLFLAGRAPDGASVDPRQMARANGAGLVVAGNYYKVGERIAFSVQLLDVASGRVVRALEPVEGEATNPLAAVEEVRRRVASALATVLDPRLRELTLPPLVPPRYDAYTEFAAGQEIYWRGDWEAALPHFRRASALDSGFSAALAFVSAAAVGTGRCALVDSVKRVFASRRPAPTDIDWITVQISEARCSSNHEEHNRLGRERAALMPGSSFATLVLSTGFHQLNRPGEALALLSSIDPARDLGWLPLAGRAIYWRELATNHHLLHDFSAERLVAERMAGAGVAPMTTAYVQARALAGMGRGDSALAVLDGLAEVARDPALVSGVSGQFDPVQLGTAGWVRYQVALELAAHRDSLRARLAMEGAARWFESASRTSSPLPAAAAVTYTRVLEWLGRYTEARAQADALARRDSTSIDAQGSLGLIAAYASDLATAERIDRWLASRPPRFPVGLPILYRAQISAVRGDTASAIATLGALPHGAHPLDVLHFHTDPTLAALRATEVMRRWILPRG